MPEFAAVQKFLERIDRLNREADPFPADRVIPSVDFLKALGADVHALVAYAGAITAEHMEEVARRNADATGVFDRHGRETS